MRLLLAEMYQPRNGISCLLTTSEGCAKLIRLWNQSFLIRLRPWLMVWFSQFRDRCANPPKGKLLGSILFDDYVTQFLRMTAENLLDLPEVCAELLTYHLDSLAVWVHVPSKKSVDKWNICFTNLVDSWKGMTSLMDGNFPVLSTRFRQLSDELFAAASNAFSMVSNYNFLKNRYDQLADLLGKTNNNA